MRFYRNCAIGALLGLVLPLQSAHAFTECTVNIARIFSGDEGNIWLFYTQGGAAAMSTSDPDKEATLTMAMTALVASRSVTVRYSGDGVACNSVRYDLTGFFLN